MTHVHEQARTADSSRPHLTPDPDLQAVTRLLAAWRQAHLHADGDAMRRLTSSDYLAIGHAGQLVDRDRYLTVHGSSPFTRFEPTIRHVQRVAGPGAMLLVAGDNTVVRDIGTTCRFLALCSSGDGGSDPSLRLQTWQETPILS